MGTKEKYFYFFLLGAQCGMAALVLLATPLATIQKNILDLLHSF